MEVKKFKSSKVTLKVHNCYKTISQKKQDMQLHAIRPLLAFSLTLAFNAPRDGWCDGCGGGGC